MEKEDFSGLKNREKRVDQPLREKGLVLTDQKQNKPTDNKLNPPKDDKQTNTVATR